MSRLHSRRQHLELSVSATATRMSRHREVRMRVHVGVMSTAFVVCCVSLLSLSGAIAKADETNLDEVNYLNTVTENTLRDLVQQSDYVVALLVAGGCKTKESVEAEKEVAKIQKDLQEQFAASIVKLSSKELVKEYGIHQLPSVVFFRQGNPALYDGPYEEDALFEWFTQNIKPSAQKLTEETFEHLTQSSSGATTGDWFVLFCNETKTSCHRLQPSWESVAGRLKHRMNIAMVDTQTSPGLVHRFRIEKDPELIFFCLGKMYRYTLSKYDVPSLSGFAMGWFTNTRAEPVPQLETPFDNLISFIVKKIKSDLKDPYVFSPLIMLTLPLAIVVAAIIAKGRGDAKNVE